MEEFLIVIQAVVGSSPTNRPILSIKHPIWMFYFYDLLLHYLKELTYNY